MQMGQGVAQWEQSLRACQESRGSTELLRALCTDLQNSVRLWLDLRLAQSPVSPTVLSHAIRAVQVCNLAFSLPCWDAYNSVGLLRRTANVHSRPLSVHLSGL